MLILGPLKFAQLNTLMYIPGHVFSTMLRSKHQNYTKHLQNKNICNNGSPGNKSKLFNLFLK